MTTAQKYKLTNPYYGGYRCRISSDCNDDENNDEINDRDDQLAYIILQSSRTINRLSSIHGERIIDRFICQPPAVEKRIRKVSYPNPVTNLINSNETCSAIFQANHMNQNQQDQKQQKQKHPASVITLENASKFDITKNHRTNANDNVDNDNILFIRNENCIQQQQEPNEKKLTRSLVNMSSISICSNGVGSGGQSSSSIISGHRRRLQIDLDTTTFFTFTN